MFRLLTASSPSFNDEDLFKQKLDKVLSNHKEFELKCLTQKVFTKMCTGYGPTKVFARDFFNHGPQTTMILYTEILDHIDGVVIFWDGETTNEKRLIELCQERLIKHRVITFESEKQQMNRLIEEAKGQPKRKREPIKVSKEAKERYLLAHKTWQLREHAEFYKASGEYKPKINPIASASSLQSFGENLFNWNGHHLERTSNVGVQRNGKWTKGQGTNGTSDNKGHFLKPGRDYAIPIYVEVKFGKDRMSDNQLWFASKVEKTGAIHTVIKTPDDWVKFYDYLEGL